MSPIGRIARAWRFGRHMPPAKLLRRFDLNLRRQLSLRLRPNLAGADAIAPAAIQPMPVFSPRTGMIARARPGWRFTFIGRTVEMGESIDWKAPGPGPADQLWRMNLHYMEYLEDVGPSEAAELMRMWTEANPPWRPGYWSDSWNSYALSLRVVVWMQQLARHGAAIPEGERKAIASSLARQLLFLEKNLERDLGGNHLVKNIKALIWASAFFEGEAAARWRKTGLRLLERELVHQMLPDGMHDERSASYHAQVLADFIEIRHATGQDPTGGTLDAKIATMSRAVTDLSHPDGGPVLFNDSGMTMAYAPAACVAAADKVSGTPPPRPSPVFGYPKAGYYGLRTNALFLAADMGRIGPDDLPAHGHGDVGSFELSVVGERLIVDQGVFEYIDGPKRRVSRATASHNTLALEGVDQAEFFGSFRCGRRPDVTVRRWESEDSSFVLEGSHNGFAHLPGRPVAVRRFEAGPDEIRITDWLEGRTDRALSVGLLLHPDAAIETDQGGLLIRGRKARLRLESRWPVAVEEAVYWPDMGRELPTNRLRIALPADFGESEIILRPV